MSTYVKIQQQDIIMEKINKDRIAELRLGYNWICLSSSNPSLIDVLEKNLDNVSWTELSRNPNAINILEKNLDNINCFKYLYENPNAIHLFSKLDTNKMICAMSEFKDELITYVFSPDRMISISQLYNCDFDKLVHMY
jgi:hypothetical protein